MLVVFCSCAEDIDDELVVWVLFDETVGSDVEFVSTFAGFAPQSSVDALTVPESERYAIEASWLSGELNVTVLLFIVPMRIS